jgi:cytoskeleton-associated protein 5
MFAHTDKTVRSEAVELAQQLYKHIGTAIEPFLADLKPVQLKDLNESFQRLDSEGSGKGTFVARRKTRDQQSKLDQDPSLDEDRAAVGAHFV